ncbi:unnamed protein product [Xylocopa violacea]|uniref:Hcy-binding domain-containing protein n=1 Tax=Xylocopa violacea TaxID=135666 RepID=A0ABP1PBD4_XYLVO
MQEVKILDGGFSTQLATHVGDIIDGDPLWTARFLITNPKAIIHTHLDFLKAGADIILTNTYQASIDGFSKYMNITEEESLNLFCKAVDYAKEARNLYKQGIENGKNIINASPLIAGSIGPYGACLHDASEYSGKYCSSVSEEMLINWHRPRIQKLLNSGVDMLAIETIPCKKEAQALVKLLREFPNSKAWLSFSCRSDGKSIADGSNFQHVALQCYRQALPGQILAIGVNCIPPQNATSLLKGINDNCKEEFVPLIIYPNSGVRYIGGCCRTNAVDVEKIRAEVEKWKSNN